MRQKSKWRLPFIAWLVGAVMTVMLLGSTALTGWIIWDGWQQGVTGKYAFMNYMLGVCTLGAWVSVIGAVVIVRAKMREEAQEQEQKDTHAL